MEQLGIAVLIIIIVVLGLYSIVKWAVKDALKEFFKERDEAQQKKDEEQ